MIHYSIIRPLIIRLKRRIWVQQIVNRVKFYR